MAQSAFQMCQCGSGLRAVRCCDLNLAAMPPPEPARHLVPLVERAIVAHRHGASELALLLFDKNTILEAEVQARNAIRIAPQNPEAHNLMGMILTEAQRPQVGEYHYRKVLELSGARNPILLANLAWNLKIQGRMEEGRALYRESAAAAPHIRQTLLGWARLEEADRKCDTASEILDRMEEQWPNDPALLLARAVLL